DRRSRLRQPHCIWSRRRVGGYAGIRRADLLRLRGLLDLCGRAWTLPRLRATDQFSQPLRRARSLGFLAPVARLALDVDAAPPVCPCRRQSARPVADRRELDDHDATRRLVAWRGLDVRRLGGAARALFDRRARRARATVVGLAAGQRGRAYV